MIAAACTALLAVDADATSAPKPPSPKREVATTDYELEVPPGAAEVIRLFARQPSTNPDRSNKEWNCCVTHGLPAGVPGCPVTNPFAALYDRDMPAIPIAQPRKLRGPAARPRLST